MIRLPFLRRRKRLRVLGESEAYGRSYGDRTDGVRVVKLEPRRPRYRLPVTGEELRRRFERLLDTRGQREERDG